MNLGVVQAQTQTFELACWVIGPEPRVSLLTIFMRPLNSWARSGVIRASDAVKLRAIVDGLA